MLLSIVLLNWKRPSNISDLIIPQLLKCPIVSKIYISHGNPTTIFGKKHPKIIHYDHTQLNHTYGLSLRFYVGARAETEDVLILDDDLIPHPATIINLFKIYQQNTPCSLGLFGRFTNLKLDYLSEEFNISKKKYYAPIALTSCLLIKKELCRVFFKRYHSSPKLQRYVKAYSQPYWNGEDIFISILSFLEYGKPPLIVSDPSLFPVKKLRSKEDLMVAISLNKTHLNYRSGLIRLLASQYGLVRYFQDFRFTM